MPESQVLIASNNREASRHLAVLLEEDGCEVLESAADVSGIPASSLAVADVVVVDVPVGTEATWVRENLALARQHGRKCEVILVAEEGNLELLALAHRFSVYEVYTNPFESSGMRRTVRRALEDRRIQARSHPASPVRSDLSRPGGELVGSSKIMRRVLERVVRFAQTDIPVLVEGETGTGKELVARLIHEQSSRSGPFLAVNCGGLSSNLVESTLFGHRKGAFTGAVRDSPGCFASVGRGTLLLDEIGTAPARLQTSLLRVLDEGEFSPVGSSAVSTTAARVIAATNEELGSAVANGRFRQDLYHRLNVARIQLPPLRDRPEDVPILVEHFLRRLTRRYRLPAVPIVHDDASHALRSHDWPGNVRELRNVLERAVLARRGRVIRLRHLEFDADAGGGDLHDYPAAVPEASDSSIPTAWLVSDGRFLTRAQAEKAHVEVALELSGWNVTQAARLLDVPRSTLRSCIRRLRIERPG